MAPEHPQAPEGSPSPSRYARMKAILDEAASAVDPLSSQGMLRALRFGMYVSYGICDWFAGRPPGLPQYAALVQAEFEPYLSGRAAVYSNETRWPEAPFWARRNPVPPVPGCGHGPAEYS